jgi:hypothetical protein
MSTLLLSERFHQVFPTLSLAVFHRMGRRQSPKMQVCSMVLCCFVALLRTDFAAVRLSCSVGNVNNLLLARRHPPPLSISITVDSSQQAELFKEAIARHRQLETLLDQMRSISQEILLQSVPGPPAENEEILPKSVLSSRHSGQSI